MSQNLPTQSHSQSQSPPIGQLDIRIGTLVPAHRGVEYVEQILPHGFESVQVAFGQTVDGDIRRYADGLRGSIRNAADVERGSLNPCVVSSVGVYGNSLIDDETIRSWEVLIDSCKDLFDCSLVTGFAGRIPDRR